MIHRSLVVVALVLWPGVGTARTWQAIQSESTRCAKDETWNFWVHRGQPDRFLLYLQGGGGCWLRANCDLAYLAARLGQGDDRRQAVTGHAGA